MSKQFTHVEISPAQLENMTKIEQLIAFKQELARRRDEVLQQFDEEMETIKSQAENLSIDTSILSEKREAIKKAYNQIIDLAQQQFANRAAIDRQSAGN